MEKFKILVYALFGVFMCLGFTACSDDKDEPTVDQPVVPSTENVFASGVPSVVGDATFTTNEKGQVTKVVENGSDVTIEFKYGSFSRAEDYQVLMEIRDAYDNEYDIDIYFKLNEDGFAVAALQEWPNDRERYANWKFEYNQDCQMTRIYREEIFLDDNDEIRDWHITYTDGNIKNITMKDLYGNELYAEDETEVLYTNDEHPSMIANIGCIMLFDWCFGIDIDEMQIAYYAGLLGKATKHLPMGYNECYKEDGYEDSERTELFRWEFNNANLPILLVEPWGEKLTFVWN
ncbi:MAG: DUF4595 domain-containing protein [Paramuribaculum sp.]|nr:DUF4595 domain-containing protein [Paramuribaculum sp.]